VDEREEHANKLDKPAAVKRKLWPSLLSLLIIIFASLSVAVLSLMLLSVHWMGELGGSAMSITNCHTGTSGQPTLPSHQAIMRELSFTLGCLALTGSLLSAYIALLQLLVALKAVKTAARDEAAGEYMLRQGVYLRFIASVLMLCSAPLVLLGAD
jgi:hypothetical protein